MNFDILYLNPFLTISKQHKLNFINAQQKN